VPEVLPEVLPTQISGDRRARRRYPIHLPLQYQVMQKGLVTSAGPGKLLDMSSTGIAFTSGDIFKFDTVIRLSIRWPILLHGDIAIKLVTEGKVVRSNGEVTVVRVLRYEFRTHSKVR